MKTLYRPVGLTEMKRILDLHLGGFPPRLPEQPIFYPVLNKPYADQIAREWNTKDLFSGYAGFVTEFAVASPYIDQYEEHVVGARHHLELWIPAEEMDDFNHQIVGPIRVVDIYYGTDYVGLIPGGSVFENQSAAQQLITWKNILECNAMDFYSEIREHWQHIFTSYPYWSQRGFTGYGLSEAAQNEVLGTMKEYWNGHFPDMVLLSLGKEAL
ncbi:hypothetical protein [Paenibacillus sp. P32E]|uniref:hypothetical protein n=1 Tax=Paenibacillus sp. P32E TaxID=1349434 RepID=UPI00093D92A7|nr:hypothetical protein [Paenibacillus sp. P32E]